MTPRINSTASRYGATATRADRIPTTTGPSRHSSTSTTRAMRRSFMFMAMLMRELLSGMIDEPEQQLTPIA